MILNLKIKYIISILVLFFCSISFPTIAKDFTIVIDPGHGGNDYGALGITSYEKNINLDIALKFGEMIKKNMPDVKVIFTRNNDTFITLQERAAIANRAKGDLFVSIHTNSVDKKSRNRNSVSGASTYTLGLHRTQENLEVAKRENSVISLENDYTTTYKGFDPSSSESYIIFEINQSKHMAESVEFASNIQNEFITRANRMDKGVRQAGFWVLAATSMPAVLVELDFICNPTQEKFLISEDGQDKMASALFNAFKKYKYSRDSKVALANKNFEDKNKDARNNKETRNNNKNSGTDNYTNLDENDALSENRLSIRKGEKKDNKKDKNKKNKKSKKKDDNEDDSSKNNLREVAKVAPPMKKDGTSKDYNSDNAKKSSNNTVQSNNKYDNRVDRLNNANDKDIVYYKIQFLTSAIKLPTNSPHFKKMSPVDFYKENGLYKYTFGETSDKNEATRMLGMVKSKFKEAFIIPFKNGQRIY